MRTSLAGFMATRLVSRSRPDAIPGPSVLQLPLLGADLLRNGDAAFDRQFERHGDVVAIPIPIAVNRLGRVVLFRDPTLVKELLTAPHEQVSNRGNMPIVDLYGTTSMVLLDGEQHLRLRRLTLPPLRGAALEGWRDLITSVAEREARRLPVGEPVRLHPRMLRSSLEIILQITVGVRGERLEEWMEPMYELLDRAVSNEFAVRYFLRGTGAFDRFWPRFRGVLAECNRLVYAEIARRRANPDERHEDILDLLIHADGEPLSHQEVRDQTMTILIAGHETSATAVSWAIERLVRHPDALAAATAEARGADRATAYAEAVMAETLRVRPPIAFFGRVTRGSYKLGPHTLARHTLVFPFLRGLHLNPDTFERPEEFRPERFVGRRPGTYELASFGGGVHRCLGERLAMFQTTIFLQTFLRELDLEPVDAADEPVKRKAIVYAPGHGTTVRARRREAA